MSNNRKKSGVLNSLRGLKSIFNPKHEDNEASLENDASSDATKEYIPELNQEIPTLHEIIPTLDEKIELNPQIKISLDASQSTETIEQQLSRTHHEQPAESPSLVEVAEPVVDTFENKLELVTDLPESTDKAEQQILDMAWQRVETLLMNHLPTELSGAYLTLLNDRVDENRLQLLSDLSLLDKDTISELVNKLKYEIKQP